MAFVAPLSVQAASLSVTASPSTVQVGNTVTVSVLVNSEGVAINNAEGSLTFPRELFDVISVSSDVSVFSLWIQAPTYNGNSAISFNGGVPSPGYLGSNGKIFNVVLRAKSSGSASFVLENAAVRANDGLGTNVFSRATGATVAVRATTPAPVTDPTQPVQTLEIVSTTHPSQDRWYASKEAVLTWKLPSGTDAVQTLLSTKKGEIPTILYRPAILEKTIKDLEDGVWYFNVRARSAGLWGPVMSHRLQIDTVPPIIRSAVATYDSTQETLVVNIDTIDERSGVGDIQVSVDGNDLGTQLFEEQQTAYQFQGQFSAGTHTAVVTVRDKAQNHAESYRIGFDVVQVEKESHIPSFSLSEFNLLALLIPTLLLSFASVFMNLVLWRKLRRYERHGVRGSGVTKLQQNTKQKLLSLKKDLQIQAREYDRARKRRDITAEDADNIKKIKSHIAEAEMYLAQKIKEINKK